jgi:hypothetical protein
VRIGFLLEDFWKDVADGDENENGDQDLDWHGGAKRLKEI